MLFRPGFAWETMQRSALFGIEYSRFYALYMPTTFDGPETFIPLRNDDENSGFPWKANRNPLLCGLGLYGTMFRTLHVAPAINIVIRHKPLRDVTHSALLTITDSIML